MRSTCHADRLTSALPSKSPLLRLLDRPVPRRIVTVGAALVVVIVAVPLSPFLVLGAWLKDRASGSRQSPTARVVVLVIGALVFEVVSMIPTLLVAIRNGFGLGKRGRDRPEDRRSWQRNRALMGWYTNTQLRFICWVLQAPIEWNDHAPTAPGPVIVMARHTSFFDALIPAAMLSGRKKMLAHHVVTAGLQFAPLIDIVGHRFPNCFISRNPGVGSRELGPIEELGSQLDENSGCIIFPEGTFRSPERFERAVRRLSRRSPDRAQQASALVHTLPPRPSGIWALLQGSPTADIIVCANTGFERFGFVRDIVRNMPSRTPLQIETWRIARADIPDEFEAFTDWLLDEFARIDRWVSEHQVPPTIDVRETSAPATAPTTSTANNLEY